MKTLIERIADALNSKAIILSDTKRHKGDPALKLSNDEREDLSEALREKRTVKQATKRPSILERLEQSLEAAEPQPKPQPTPEPSLADRITRFGQKVDAAGERLRAAQIQREVDQKMREFHKSVEVEAARGFSNDGLIWDGKSP